MKSGSLLKRKSNDSSTNEDASCSNASGTHQSKGKIRRYSDEYLSFGFTYICQNVAEQPQCVLCYDILSNECMKPAKLRRHLETKHKEHISKSVEYFKIKQRELHASQKSVAATTKNLY